jgi:hypothetical protein
MEKWAGEVTSQNSGLILVDIQYDFLRGSLAVPEADQILPTAYALLDERVRWKAVVASQVRLSFPNSIPKLINLLTAYLFLVVLNSTVLSCGIKSGVCIFFFFFFHLILLIRTSILQTISLSLPHTSLSPLRSSHLMTRPSTSGLIIVWVHILHEDTYIYIYIRLT